jgi:hypothetical protein
MLPSDDQRRKWSLLLWLFEDRYRLKKLETYAFRIQLEKRLIFSQLVILYIARVIFYWHRHQSS